MGEIDTCIETDVAFSFGERVDGRQSWEDEFVCCFKDCVEKGNTCVFFACPVFGFDTLVREALIEKVG